MKRVTFGALVVALTAAPAARAGNLDSVFVSDQAAMMGGAVTALASDNTAIFYNPAGLAADTSHASVSLSTSSYGISMRSSETLASDNNGVADDLTTAQVLSVPAAVAFYFPLNKRLGAGFGLFAPSAINQWLRNAVDITNGATTARLTSEARIVGTDMRIGGGLGFALTDTLRIGACLFATYTTLTVHYDFSAIANDATGTSFGVVSINDEAVQLGAQPTLGAQWQPVPQFIVGATVFAPQLQFSSQNRLSAQQSAFGSTAGAAADNPFVTENEGVSWVDNPRFFLGVGYKGERLRVGLEGNYQHPKGDNVRSQLWNGRVGAQFLATEGVWVGLGAFTDRSPNRFDASSLLTESVDFFGTTAGVRIESTYLARMIRSWHGVSDDDAREQTLLFFTALTARYAHGTGKTPVVFLDPASGELGSRGASLTVNEVSAQLSTGIAF